jgi:inner membrane protein
MRTSKYGLMIIVLTFLSFFMIELFGKKAIHPIQYLLIGLALIIFYSLLLAISEYLSFDLSYLISAVLVISLISFYVISVYKSMRIGIIIFTALTVFYGLMYTILQLQDYSLLVGNISLFALLAAVMFFTRKINWFDVLNPKTN